MGSDELGPEDSIWEAIKHGTLHRLYRLSRNLKALTGKHLAKTNVLPIGSRDSCPSTETV